MSENIAGSLQNNLFAYGTLAQPDMQLELLGRICPMSPATLDGYRIHYGKWPYLVPSQGDSVSGWIIETLSDAEIERLDAYEKDLDALPGADDIIYTREQKRIRVGATTKLAWVYFPILEKWPAEWKES